MRGSTMAEEEERELGGGWEFLMAEREAWISGEMAEGIVMVMVPPVDELSGVFRGLEPVILWKAGG